MPTAETRIPTDRAARYLAQLCQHLNQISRHTRHGGGTHGIAPPQVRRVEWNGSHGVIEFASGTCAMDVASDELTIKLAAVDTDELQQLQELLSARLETIGRRDNLVVTW